VLLPFSIPALAAFYVTTFILLFQQPWWRRRLELLAPVGRMALTNYLSQSLVCVFLYYGVGLGLMDRVNPATTIPIALIIFCTQVAWSHWWMARFRFGPAEWLWRSLTYARIQPMKRRLVG
jgi:uncharacterized protein